MMRPDRSVLIRLFSRAPSNDLMRGQPDALTVPGCRTGQGRSVSRSLARAAAVGNRRVTGLSREVLAELVAELGPRWQARQDARLADRPRRRAVGAGARYRLVFLDRLLATLVHLCHGVTHDVLAC
jgi:hypothetical protein